MKNTKFSTSKLPPEKMFGKNLTKNQILDSSYIRKHAEFVINCMSIVYFCSQVGTFFRHDKILKLLLSAD